MQTGLVGGRPVVWSNALAAASKEERHSDNGAMYENGWRAVRSFPVEGDSAEYKVWLHGELFALMWLDRN
jgi:hypothetical protein